MAAVCRDDTDEGYLFPRAGAVQHEALLQVRSGVQVVVHDDDVDDERPSGIAAALRHLSVSSRPSVSTATKRHPRRRSIMPRLPPETSWTAVTAATAPARLAQEGARLCAKAQVHRQRRSLQAADDGEDILAMWPGGRTAQYAVREAADGQEEVLLCAGSPVGELAFFGETESHTVRPVCSLTWPKHIGRRVGGLQNGRLQ